MKSRFSKHKSNCFINPKIAAKNERRPKNNSVPKQIQSRSTSFHPFGKLNQRNLYKYED